MKKVFINSAIAFFAACALASCAKDNLKPADVETSLHFSITTAEDSPLKSYLDNNRDGSYTPMWSKGDQLAMFVGDITSSTSEPTAILSNQNEDGVIAKFDGDVPTSLTDGSFLSFSPAGAFVKGYDGTVGINLSEIQNPSSLTIDEACDVLVAKQCDFMAENGVVAINDLYFKRIFSIVKVNVKGVEALNSEKVTSFTLNAPVTLTGRAAVDLSTASISKWNVDNKSVVAKYTTDNPVFGGENGLENTVWFVVNPTTIASGSTITFSGETENYTFSKDVTLTKDVVFPRGQIAVINLTIGEGNYVAKAAETRIFVEGFDNVETTKTQLQPSVTGASGTGVTDALAYEYSSKNTNLRFNDNGHSSTNPYLYLSAANDNLIISNIEISGETALKFSCQAKTNSGSSTITINYKESSAESWSEAGNVSVGTESFDTVNPFIFTVDSDATSLDIQIVGSDVAIVDDLVLESFVDARTTLSAPANVSVSVDAETPNTLNVSWDAVENASGYEVVLSADGKDDIVKTATGSPLAVADLDYSTMYSVKVKATTTDVENYIESEYSTVVSGTTGAKPEGEAEWVSTSFANLKAGDKVVIVRTSGTTYAMTNDKGTSAAPAVKAVTVSGNKLAAAPESNIVWYVGVEGANKIFYTSSEQTSWLYCNSSNNGIRVGDNTNKTFTIDGGYLKHIGTSRFIGVYNNDDWRCYTSKTGNIANQTFGFFVEQSGSSEGGSNPVKLAAPVVSCSAQTENSLTFTWEAVANASGYQVSTDGGASYKATQTETTYTWSGLSAETSYTLYVKAVGDNVSYTDSEAVSATGTTTASSGGEGGEGGTTKYFVKVTSETEIVDDGKYLFVYDGKAVSGTTSEVYLTVAAVTIDGDKIESNSTTETYAFTVNSASSGYTLKISDNYIGYNTSTKFSSSPTTPTSDKYYWTFTLQKDGSVLIKNVNNTSRFIGANSSTDVTQFRAYSTTNLSSYPKPTLYKLAQ